MTNPDRKIRYVNLPTLKKIRANNYTRLSLPYHRYDPEIIDREIFRKTQVAKKRLAKYTKGMIERGVEV